MDKQLTDSKKIKLLAYNKRLAEKKEKQLHGSSYYKDMSVAEFWIQVINDEINYQYSGEAIHRIYPLEAEYWKIAVANNHGNDAYFYYIIYKMKQYNKPDTFLGFFTRGKLNDLNTSNILDYVDEFEKKEIITKTIEWELK